MGQTFTSFWSSGEETDKKPMKEFNFPKVQLHLHLDGCLRFSTILELANKKKIDLKGAKTVDELKKVLVTYVPSSLADVLRAFDIFLPVIVGDLEAIERVAYETCEDQSREGVIYFEGRYAPNLLSNESVTPSDVVKAVWRGFERGHKDFGIIARSILCCIRNHDEWNNEIVNLVTTHKEYGVVAIDAAGCSSGADEQYEPSVVAAFKLAESNGVHRTVHAGEAGGAKSVIRGVEDMHTERVGHGYHLLSDEDAYQKYALNGRLHLEACPLSSMMTGSVPVQWNEHPVVRWAKDGANFSLSTDDPTCFDNSVTSELSLVNEKIGLSEDQIWICQLNAAKSSFLDGEEKEKLVKLIESYRPAILSQ